MITRDAVALLCVAEGVLNGDLRHDGRPLIGGRLHARLMDALVNGGWLSLEHEGILVRLRLPAAGYSVFSMPPEELNASLGAGPRMENIMSCEVVRGGKKNCAWCSFVIDSMARVETEMRMVGHWMLTGLPIMDELCRLMKNGWKP